MGKKTKLLCSVIAMLSVFQNYSIVDAMQSSVDNEVKYTIKNEQTLPPAPIVFEGEDISYDQATGEVYAKGNVKITQKTANLTADEIKGNMQTADVWIDGKAHITQQEKPVLDLNGYMSHYNYQKHQGSMGNVVGKADDKYIKGEKIEFFPEEIIVYNGMLTKCPAKKPDYHMSASKIEIWPNKRMIAYDAKFWLKNRVIYSTKRYETEIGENAKNTAFPKIGYNNDDGMYIRQKFDHFFTEDLFGFANIGYFSKSHFKNEYGLKWHKPEYSLILEAGDFQDSDDHWIKKEPSVRFIYPNRKIGNTPYSYRFDAEYGKWSDDDKKSWHQDYELYFSRDPIALSNSLNLYLGAGYEVIKESYDHSQINTIKYDATLHKTLSSKLNVWTGYHYTKNDTASTLFNYDNPDVGKELASGISYRFDDKNKVVIAQSYDVENSRVADMDYTWYRDLHCWQASLTYREKRDEWKIKFDITHW